MQCLELVATIGAYRANPEREFHHDVVDEVDGVGLRVATVDLECPNSRGVIDGGVLVAPNRRSLLAREREKLDVYLYMVARNLFFVSMGVNRPATHSIGEPVHAVPLADAVQGRVGGLDVMVAL